VSGEVEDNSNSRQRSKKARATKAKSNNKRIPRRTAKCINVFV
jgi:hypothetical protein